MKVKEGKATCCSKSMCPNALITFHYIESFEVLLLLAVLGVPVFEQCRGLYLLNYIAIYMLNCASLILECSMSNLYYHMVTCVCQYNVIEMLYLYMTIKYLDIKMPYPDFKVTEPDILWSH